MFNFSECLVSIKVEMGKKSFMYTHNDNYLNVYIHVY